MILTKTRYGKMPIILEQDKQNIVNLYVNYKMNIKSILNATWGIATEVIYTLVIMLAAFLICLVLNWNL